MSDIEQYDVEALAEFESHDSPFHMFSEHGKPWITCLPCGATWSIHEDAGNHLGVEEVTEGDGTCPSEDDDEP